MSVPLRTAGGYSLLVILAPLRRIGANAEPPDTTRIPRQNQRLWSVTSGMGSLTPCNTSCSSNNSTKFLKRGASEALIRIGAADWTGRPARPSKLHRVFLRGVISELSEGSVTPGQSGHVRESSDRQRSARRAWRHPHEHAQVLQFIRKEASLRQFACCQCAFTGLRPRGKTV